VKLKYKRATEPSYASTNIIEQVKEVRSAGANFVIQHFFMSLAEAKKLMFSLIMRNSDENNWFYDGGDKLEYVAIVELSNYAPYPEYQVIDYREFK